MREAAQQFEALLMQRMLKEMRAATPGDGLFDSQQLDSYYELFDKQVALDLARGGGLGLADQLVGQLNSAARHGAAAAERPAQAGSGPASPADSTRLPARPAQGPKAQGPNQGPRGPCSRGPGSKKAGDRKAVLKRAGLKKAPPLPLFSMTGGLHRPPRVPRRPLPA